MKLFRRKEGEGASRGEACGYCGFDPEGVSPADAAVALRSFARRYSELVVELGPGAGTLLAHRSGGRWTALEHLCHVRDALDTKRTAVQRVLLEDEPQLGWVEVEAPHAGDNRAEPEAVLSDLAANAERMAGLIAATPGPDWSRVGTRGGHEVSALHIVHQAVHECAHHLRQAGRPWPRLGA